MSDDFDFEPSRFEFSVTLQRVYERVNKDYFNFRLPNVRVGYYHDLCEMDDAHAYTVKLGGAKYTGYILINPHFREWPGVLEQTIIHEAIHVKFNNAGGHGPKFQKEKKRLILAGAFDDTL